MMRTMVVAVLFFFTFSCFVGCATAPEPKKVENQVTEKVENKISEWQKLPDNPESPGQQFFGNARTNAIVSIGFIPLNVRVSDAIHREAERMSSRGMEADKVMLSDNDETGTFSFTGLIAGRPVNGLVTIMRVEPNRPLLIVLGLWPIEFDEEMTTHYKGIIKEIVHKLKSEK